MGSTLATSWSYVFLRFQLRMFLEQFIPGMYAVRVTGMPPEYVMDELTARNYQFIPRDRPT